jgi:hypothetical protein
MRNLNAFPVDCFSVFSQALSRKQDPDLRARLSAITASIQIEYDLYQNQFNSNTLEALLVNPIFEPYKEDLLSLYSFDSATMRNARKVIEANQSECVRYTCPYCGLDSTGCLDHYLPKTIFPIFCVNPINLIPACPTCNGPKSQIWLSNGSRVFLNPYLDILPNVQYLFVDVGTEPNGDMNFVFSLRNINGIDGNLFGRLEVHFEKLYLLDRMRRAATGYVTEFLNGIKRHLNKGLTWAEITRDVADKVSDDRAAYGANYWKSALETGLINSPIFLNEVRA